MLGAFAVVVLLTVLTAGVALGGAVIARHRAQAAADLAALAAAGALPAGPVPACEQARALASAMHTILTGCQVDDLDVIVTVDAAVRVGNWALEPARAAARAGPA